jgi:hypothetical protein
VQGLEGRYTQLARRRACRSTEARQPRSGLLQIPPTGPWPSRGDQGRGLRPLRPLRARRRHQPRLTPPGDTFEAEALLKATTRDGQGPHRLRLEPARTDVGGLADRRRSPPCRGRPRRRRLDPTSPVTSASLRARACSGRRERRLLSS